MIRIAVQFGPAFFESMKRWDPDFMILQGHMIGLIVNIPVDGGHLVKSL